MWLVGVAEVLDNTCMERRSRWVGPTVPSRVLSPTFTRYSEKKRQRKTQLYLKIRQHSNVIQSGNDLRRR